jgi:hypothetical protein
MAKPKRELPEFARWLTQRMSVLQLKNSDVAEAAQVTGPAVSLWRTGINVPDNDRIEPLADILQVTSETILLKLGRLKPREGISREWEDIISRFQEAGPEAERLIFALGDSLLLALARAANRTDMPLSLDPIFNPAAMQGLRSSSTLADYEHMLSFQNVQMPGTDDRAWVMVTALATDVANHYRLIADISAPKSYHLNGELRVGGAAYQAKAENNQVVFDDVLFDSTVRRVMLSFTQ